MNSRCSDFKGCGSTNPSHKVRISSSSETNVMGEYSGVTDIAMSMNCINPIYHRNPQSGRQRSLLKFTDQLGPIISCRPTKSRTVTSAEHTPKVILVHYSKGGVHTINLGHLTNLLFQSHPAQEVLYSNFNRLIWILVLHICFCHCHPPNEQKVDQEPDNPQTSHC
uniref:Uncharacterized protein n=1 Tax=Opuntia streptacantha TaxID=393608 RepID=A0A7C9EC06_OPUST